LNGIFEEKLMNRLPLHVDELLGVVKCNSDVRFFGAWLAEWIFDYPGYDPGYDPTQDHESLRGGLAVVRPDQGAEFCEAMRTNAIDAAELREYLKRHSSTTPIDFYIDFDSALYINGFHEVPVEDYVPTGWQSMEDDPMKHVPEEVRSMWHQTP
jgi:hypothetical protein